MTSEQIRAARAMLRMEQSELAELAGVSTQTIKRLEGMDGEISGVRDETLVAIEKVLNMHGIHLLSDYSGKGIILYANISFEDAVFEDLPILFPGSKRWIRTFTLAADEHDFEGSDKHGNLMLVQARRLNAGSHHSIIDNAYGMVFANTEEGARFGLVLEGFPFKVTTKDGIEIVPYDVNNRPTKAIMPVSKGKKLVLKKPTLG